MVNGALAYARYEQRNSGKAMGRRGVGRGSLGFPNRFSVAGGRLPGFAEWKILSNLLGWPDCPKLAKPYSQNIGRTYAA